MNKTEDPAALAVRAKAGDVEAFGRLYELVYTDLYRYAFYHLGDTQAAEDAVQDTAVEAFRAIHKLKNAAAFRSWIFTILYARCSRGIRELIRQREQDPLEDVSLSVNGFAEASDEAIRKPTAVCSCWPSSAVFPARKSPEFWGVRKVRCVPACPAA